MGRWWRWDGIGGECCGRVIVLGGALVAFLFFSGWTVMSGRAGEGVPGQAVALRAQAGSQGKTRTGRANTLAGPVPAELVEVIDGDTLRVRARIWLGQEITVLVRLRGVDTPELRGKCEREKQMARAAREFVSRAAASGPLMLSEISGGKYYGRVVATVSNAQGHSLAPLLLDAGLARAYGGARRGGWCGRALR